LEEEEKGSEPTAYMIPLTPQQTPAKVWPAMTWVMPLAVIEMMAATQKSSQTEMTIHLRP
jgi:hypothetical protein